MGGHWIFRFSMGSIGALLIWVLRFKQKSLKEIYEENELRNVLVGFGFVILLVLLVNTSS